MNLDNPLLSLSGFGLLGLSSSCKQKRHLPITKNGFFYPLDCLLLGPLSCTFCQVDCTIFCQPLTPQLNVNKESEWIFRVKSSPKKRVCWFHDSSSSRLETWKKIKACLQNLIAIFSSWSLIQLFDFFYEIKHSLNSWLNASLVLNLGVKKIQLVTGISYEFVMYAMISFDMPTLLSYLKKWVPWIKNNVLTYIQNLFCSLL